MSSAGKRVLKIVSWVVGSILALLVILFIYVQLRWDAGDGRPTTALTAPTDSASIAHGEYIFKFQAQCWSCHQYPHVGMDSPPNGGMPFDLTEVGPGFGTWYSRNLTPDVETGIGGWTDGQIVQALREGLSKDHSPLFPIMPADWYHGMSDQDVLSVVAYLKSRPAVKNVVPRREPSFIAKALFTFNVIKPKDPVTSPVIAPPKGITVEYGRYLSSNVADCADCHTPRSLDDGRFYLDSLFAGGSFPFGGGPEGPILSTPRNLTPDKETGIGLWNEEQFFTAVVSGMRPDSTVLAPHMPYAYYKFLDSADLKAIWVFLKSLPAIKRRVPPNEYEAAVMSAHGADRGKLLFRARCQVCHGENGGGAHPTKVKLAEVATSLTDADLTEFVSGGQLNLKMPAFGKTLTKDELADIVAYVRSWEASPGQGGGKE